MGISLDLINLEFNENFFMINYDKAISAVATSRNLLSQIQNIAQYLDGAIDLAEIFPEKCSSSYSFVKLNTTMIIFEIIIIALSA